MAHTQKVKKFFFLEPALGLLAVWLLVVLTITVYQNQVYARGLLYFLILVLTVIVLTFLKINGLLYFYIFFELSIAPIFLIILIWGYQRERLFASLSILLYTFIASLPLLFLIIFLNQTRRTRALTLLLINDLVSPQHSMLLTLRLLTAFLVKTPLYLTHMWLPKAHVEAPVYGSIILAAILLKIGTFGLVLLAGASYTASFVWGVLRVRIWSMVRVAAFCTKVIDIKVLVAYSSVSHIGLLLRLIFLNQTLRLTTASLTILTHGFTSSALFFTINLIYENSNSRSTLFNKGVLFISSYNFAWAIILISNIRAPPTVNFFAELLSIFRLLNSNFNILFIVVPFIVFTTAYSYLVYSVTTQLRTNKATNLFNHKKNYMILLAHLTPIFFIVVNLQMTF